MSSGMNVSSKMYLIFLANHLVTINCEICICQIFSGSITTPIKGCLMMNLQGLYFLTNIFAIIQNHSIIRFQFDIVFHFHRTKSAKKTIKQMTSAFSAALMSEANGR